MSLLRCLHVGKMTYKGNHVSKTFKNHHGSLGCLKITFQLRTLYKKHHRNLYFVQIPPTTNRHL